MSLRVAIAGGGIAGLATALALVRAGHRPQVFERRDEGAPAGGAMMMWPNGMAALDALGVGARVHAGATAVREVEFRAQHGRSLARWSLAELGLVHVVFRAALLQALREALPGDAVVTGATVSSARPQPDAVEFTLADGSHHVADALVACDGVHSRLRAQLFGTVPPPQLHQLAWLATVPHDDLAAIPHGVAIGSVGRGQRFCAARIDDARVFWYATVNATRRPAAPGVVALAQAFGSWHDPVAALVRAAEDPAVELVGPVELGELAPLRHWCRGRVTLLGDAAHACLPDLGQGAGQALHSAVVLAQCLGGGADVEAALLRYEQRRRRAVAEVMRTSRLVASLSMSEAVHIASLRELVVGALLPTVGFPRIESIAADART
ncbi:MAG: FAD-dependent monooxygenase [Nannocystaceae bacterium]